MKETGIVLELQTGGALVAFERKGACEKCGMCKMLDNHMTTLARNDAKARVGDEVEVSMEATSFVSAVLIMYVLPLIAMLAGLVIASLLGASELVQFGCALLAAAATFLIIRATEPRRAKKDRYIPAVTAVIRRND